MEHFTKSHPFGPKSYYNNERDYCELEGRKDGKQGCKCLAAPTGTTWTDEDRLERLQQTCAKNGGKGH